jgi:transposase
MFSMSTALLPDPTQLRLTCLSASDTVITVVVSTTGQEALCPLCHRSSSRVHSRYQRTLADLPWSGLAVRLRLHARRFFCDNVACERHIFTERIPTVAAPYARRTTRLAAWFMQVAFALGGAPGTRLLHRGGCAISRETLLGSIRACTREPPLTPRVLSVDDFAFRKGRTYGTILVDLERHRVVDLLPDRSADAVATWLREHPGVEIVSRDRGGEYAEGVKRGAPAAVQVADRFHLLRNAGDVTWRVLQRHSAVVQRLPAPGSSPHGLSRLRLDREASREQTRATMRERFEQVHALAAAGMSKEVIAQRLGLNRKTVYKYLALQASPQRRYTSRLVSALAPYEGYLLRRWAEGCRNARQVWREIREQGYAGAYRNVARVMGSLRQQERLGKAISPAPSALTPRQAVGVVLRRADERSADQRQTVEQLKALDREIQHAVQLLERFARLLREGPYPHPEQQLDHWIAEAASSGLPEFDAFVTKLRQDQAAVLAGLRLPWSQGQTEGQITKLKLLKRSMYGRAGFALLKQRMLHAQAAA